MKRIIVAVTNDLVTDQRVHRVCRTLHEEGYHVTLVGRRLRKSKKVKFPFRTWRMVLLFRTGVLFYAEYNIRLLFFLLFRRVDAILSNDMDTLPSCYLASLIRFKPLVFDSHEFFSEVPELVHRPFQKSVWQAFENFLIPRLKFTYTVCYSIAEEYQKRFDSDFKVIRNVPEAKSYLPIEKEGRIVLYQGSLNVGRGLEMLISAMAFLPDTTLWIAGTGDIHKQLQNQIVQMGLQERIKFLGRISVEKLHEITVKASIGVSLEENMGLNYYFALPNKIFDYIQARIPIIVSNLPEMRRLVKAFDIGEILTDRRPEELAALINHSLNDVHRMEQWKLNLEHAAEILTWENEAVILRNIFSNALR